MFRGITSGRFWRSVIGLVLWVASFVVVFGLLLARSTVDWRLFLSIPRSDERNAPPDSSSQPPAAGSYASGTTVPPSDGPDADSGRFPTPVSCGPSDAAFLAARPAAATPPQEPELAKRATSSDPAHPAPAEGSDRDLAFEAQLWKAADALRNNMDAAEYKHVVLGLIFLKYISDAFEAKHAELEAGTSKGTDPEDPDEYKAENIFWVPPGARWSHLLKMAKQPTIGKVVDDAMDAIERDNPVLKGVLPKDFARPGLDKQRLGQLIDLIGNIGFGGKSSRSRDMLGRVYEYFLSEFASAEGKKGGQFYTPRPVVKLLVSMLAPYKGRIYDPCCGSAGMFVQSEEFIEHHGGRVGDIAVYGQESNYTTWRLAKMNLAIRGIDAKITQGDSFHNDQHQDLKADFVIANPPFNDSDWNGHLLKEDKRWKHGVPPPGNANFAWVQHFLSKLSPTGIAGFVLANGSMSSNSSGEGDIRKSIVEADLVDCMVALPGQLFYSTQIPVCLWFLARDKKNGRFRDRCGHVLFIDARKMGTMIDRVQRTLTDADIATIADTFHAWRGDKQNLPKGKTYADVPGFCKSATLDEIRAHGHVLTPGRYVGAEEVEDDGVPFEVKMAKLTGELAALTAQGADLDRAIAANLAAIGFPIPAPEARK
ncbi:MAG: SAM-dependent DNA methyltransferase [Phycisphaeraceae bacterium]|nr:SAM-dependent DNA methyltransferase [Phycisphaeraceae bacterium]QYK49812.1 MAG: SAM-dependent DNA methyltransferase [Phycisphaeraceae bacterium]